MKHIAILIVLALVASALCGCGGASAQDGAIAIARPVDLDLTALSSTVVYSQVFDMMENPDRYMGKLIKMRGNFSYFQDPNTGKEYFAAIIADATACCAQGIEFVLAGKHAYPADYPPLDSAVTVTGIFDTYVEDGILYIQLTDARMEA